MSPRQRTAIKIGLAVFLVTALGWLIVRTIRNRGSYTVDAITLSGWTLVAGEPGARAIVALQPPAQLTSDLFRQLSLRTRQPLMVPPHPSVPLVLQSEYSESLQGVWSVDDIVRLARETDLETTRFEPICIGQLTESISGQRHQLFFVVFSAQAFDEFRQQLTPLFPEHGGWGVFDPGALRPVMTIAATDREFGIRWPLALKQQTDCQASLRIN